MSTDRRHSTLIHKHIPEYIRKDHPNFVLFMEAYYEWMEESGNALDINKNLLPYQDIDKTLDSYISYFKKEFLSRIPETLYVDPTDSTRNVDKRKLIKHIREFYRARGTEKSYRFLFRILFDTEIDFYYPRVDMLRVSDGKWFQNITLRVRQETGDPFEWIGQKVRGADSNSSAFVENVQKILVGPLEVYELFLNRSTIIGHFLPDEEIASDDVSGVSGQTYHLLTGLTIINPGSGYSIGDIIEIDQAGPGFGAKAKVTNVDDDGAILKTQIIDYGAGYSSGISPADIIFPTQADQAMASATIGGQTLYPGYYLNDDGKLSNSKFIQDSYFYQQFSYVIKANQSLDTYRTLIKELIHPAGLILFGELFTKTTLNIGAQLPRNQSGGFITVHRFSGFEPYGLSETNSVVPKNYFIQDYVINAAPEIIPQRILRVETQLPVYGIGPSFRSFDQFKFTSLPEEGFDGNDNFVAPNEGYYDSESNYQIAQFEDYKLYLFSSSNSFLTLLITSGTGTFIPDEEVFQGTITDTAFFRGKVVDYDDSGYLIIEKTFGNYNPDKALVGITSAAVCNTATLLKTEQGRGRKINLMPEPVLSTSS